MRGQWLRAARVVHPFPTAANGLAVVLFAVIATHGTPPPGTTARLVATILLIQCAIGAANDAVDVDLDRATKPWKPIPSGAIGRGGAWTVAALAALTAAVLAALSGPGAWLLAMAGLACGLAYDLRLKRSAWSAVPYMLALPLLPLWVWVALGRYRPALLWVYPLGALLGISLYLGNTAPDIAGDSSVGVRGAAHRLGERNAVRLSWVAFALAIAGGAALAPVVGLDEQLVLPIAAAAAALLVLAIVVARSWRPEALLRGWGVQIVATLLFAVGWLAALP
jgi:4-hydroxybenzoate polyprenyltransferase